MPDSVKPAASAPKAEAPVQTIVIDLGNKKPKQVRQLRKGKGKLMDSVQETLQRLRQEGTIPKGVPSVVVVVGKRPRRKRLFA